MKNGGRVPRPRLGREMAKREFSVPAVKRATRVSPEHAAVRLVALALREDREQPHGRQEERLTERVHLAAVGVPIQEIDSDRAR